MLAASIGVLRARRGSHGRCSRSSVCAFLSTAFDHFPFQDMPTTLPDGLCLAAITAREDPEDVLVVHADHKGCGGVAGLPKGAIIGTSSLRRAALLRKQFPHVVPEVVRGNLQVSSASCERVSSKTPCVVVLCVCAVRVHVDALTLSLHMSRYLLTDAAGKAGRWDLGRQDLATTLRCFNSCRSRNTVRHVAFTFPWPPPDHSTRTQHQSLLNAFD